MSDNQSGINNTKNNGPSSGNNAKKDHQNGESHPTETDRATKLLHLDYSKTKLRHEEPTKSEDGGRSAGRVPAVNGMHLQVESK